MVLNAFKSRIFLLQPTKGTTKDSTTFMNSENSKTSEPCRLLLNLSDKTNIKRSDKYIALSNYLDPLTPGTSTKIKMVNHGKKVCLV